MKIRSPIAFLSAGLIPSVYQIAKSVTQNPTVVNDVDALSFARPPHDDYSSSANTSISTISSAESFLKWGDRGGIGIDSIVEYMHFSSWPSNIDLKTDILDPNDLSSGFPNVMYIFGASSLTTMNNKRLHETSRERSYFIWRESRKNSLLPEWIMEDRYLEMEQLLKDSLEYLFDQFKSSQNKGRWKRLKHLFWNENGKAILSSGVPMIVNLDDARICSKRNLVLKKKKWTVPVWRFTAVEDCPMSLLLPTSSFTRFAKDHQNSLTRALRYNHFKYPWSSKERKVVWRGSLYHWGPKQKRMEREILNHPRNWMIQMANNRTEQKKHGDIAWLDVKINREPIIFEDFQKSMGVLDVNDNSFSERFQNLLCMSSVVLKVQPQLADFSLPTLQPWVHFVPVKSDSSDLWNQTKWVLDPTNTARVHQIIQSANEWCAQNMVYNATKEYILTSLDRYVELLERKDPKWSKTWSRALEWFPASNYDWQAI